jgi:predicted Ser/Thr protein kinase/tetratricopeptide (TPR) repeat protein
LNAGLDLLDAERILRGALVCPPKPGDRFGQFTLLRFLGKGASGSVFEAEQDAPVRRRVAVKVLSGVEGSAAAERRFEAERRALASLAHAGIATILDGGMSDDGTPWFAMELVAGRPVDAFADASGLDVRARVRLVAEAADAVEHAHRRGVLHRDLKPSNLLVESREDGSSRLKVIDFGLARFLDAPASDPGADAGMPSQAPDMTVAGHVIGTPAYMSPEAASSESWRIDARSDVWSLGAILHRLLCGMPPHVRRAGESSSVVLERARRGDLAEARARLAALRLRRHDDLAAVACRALARDPDDRYQGPAEFAEDLRRWLDGHPVRARPVGPAGRAGRLAMRHPVATSLALVLSVGMAATTVLAVLGAREARRQQLEAERRAVAMKDAVEPLLGMVQISRLADESVGARERLLAAYEEIYGPDDTRTNTRRIGLAQTLVGAGDYDGAVAQFRRIRDVAARKGLPETHVAALRIDAGIANALRRKGDHDGALREAGRVVLLLDAVHGGCDQNEQLARLVRGAVRMLEGDAAGALADARCAVDLLDRCPDTVETSRIIATSFLADAMCNAGLEDEGRSLIRDLRARSTQIAREMPSLSGLARQWRAQEVLEAAERRAPTDPGGAALLREAEAKALESELGTRTPAYDRLRSWAAP